MRFSTITTGFVLFGFFIPNSIALINQPGIPLVSVSRIYILFWVVIFIFCPSSNKWNRRSGFLMESFVPHGHVTRRVVDSANDVSRWFFS